MSIHILPGPTLISSLMPSGGGTLESGDTIELSGHDLIVDTDAVSYPVTLSNDGAEAHLELRDGGRIKLDATLPTSICPWVDPENPLPESNYTAGLTANASAEIQIGAFSLGGGPASLPTATRSGGFWALCKSSSDSSHVTFDRDFPLHSGDVIVNAAIQTGSSNNTCKVVSYDDATRTAQIDKTGASKTVGQLWFLVAGGVLIHRTNYSSNIPVITSVLTGGTINLLGYYASTNNYAIGASSPIVATRISFKMQNASGNFVMSGLLGGNACIYARDVAADPLCSEYDNEKKCLVADECATWRQQSNPSDLIVVRGGYIHESGKELFAVNTSVNSNVLSGRCKSRLVNSRLGGAYVRDTQFELSGTVSRVSRTDFPVDTDLPDAFYFSPTTSEDVPWRYEDYWVRKGETLRLSCRAMRGGDTSSARVAIGEMAVWVPAEGMPVLAEWRCDGGQALEWQGGSLEWTNDTGEDCQVRVWSMATGEHGAYLRVWRATGGAM